MSKRSELYRQAFLERAELLRKNKKMRECLIALKTTRHDESPCDEYGNHFESLCDVCKKIDEALK